MAVVMARTGLASLTFKLGRKDASTSRPEFRVEDRTIVGLGSFAAKRALRLDIEEVFEEVFEAFPAIGQPRDGVPFDTCERRTRSGSYAARPRCNSTSSSPVSLPGQRPLS